MLLTIMKSKIHRATVTETELDYVGSLTLDPDLIEAAGMLPNERVQVVNLNNGARMETYIIKGERGSRTVCLNGPAARLGCVGDVIIALTYAQMDAREAPDFNAKVVHVDEQNRVLRVDSVPSR